MDTERTYIVCILPQNCLHQSGRDRSTGRQVETWGRSEGLMRTSEASVSEADKKKEPNFLHNPKSDL